MKRKYPIAVAIAAIALLLGACGGGGASSGPGGAPLSGGTFTMNLGTDPGTINPYKTTGGTNRQIFAFSYDTLVGRAPDGTTVPQLATDWQVTPNSVTYTLRDGVTCEDGTPLTPSDVAADFDYVKDPATLPPWISLTVPVPYTASADDAANTVTITTQSPFGMLLEGAGSLPIVCPGGLTDAASIEHDSNGTGPYTVTEYVPGDRGRLLSDGLTRIYVSPGMAVAPSVAIVLAGLTFNLVGEWLSDVVAGRNSAPRALRRDQLPAAAPTEDEPAEPSGSLVDVRHLRVVHPASGGGVTTPVRDVSFSLAPNERVGIVGESGSGKSMTASAIAQLIARPVNRPVPAGQPVGRAAAAGGDRPCARGAAGGADRRRGHRLPRRLRAGGRAQPAAQAAGRAGASSSATTSRSCGTCATTSR